MPGIAARLCSLVLLLLAAKASLAVVQNLPETDSAAPAKKLSIGNLREVNFKGGNGHYTLNGTDLLRVSTESVVFNTADQSYRVQATLLRTVLLSNGRPIDSRDSKLVSHWSKTIPRVAQILKW